MNFSIVKKASDAGLVDFRAINFRTESNPVVDDYAFGGSSGMVLKVDPIVSALRENDLMDKHKILLTPSGQTLTQSKLRELANMNKDIVLICGHYEGFDARIEDYVDEEISIGDYVLTSGELSALVLLDGITRLIPGVLNENSIETESFDGGLLDFPVYTRPREFEGKMVPEVYLSGNHQKIKKFREEERIRVTKKKRPDLYEKYLKKI